MENPPWKEVARSVRRGVSSHGSSSTIDGVNARISALLGLRVLPDCPPEYLAQTADLRFNGNWSPIHESYLQLIDRLTSS